MSPGECRDYLASAAEKPLLLDVREPWEYNIARLDDAMLVPMRQIPGEVGSLDPERETVVICHHGIRSRQVAMYLEHIGFTNVINLRGGIAAWAQEVDPQMPTY